MIPPERVADAAEPSEVVVPTAVYPEAMASAAASPKVAHAAERSEAAALASAPCVVVVPSNVLSTCYVVVEGTKAELCTCPVKENVNELSLFPDGTAVEPPEVAGSTTEPPELSMVSTYALSLSACPVTAMKAVCELSACPVTAMEVVYELPCLVCFWTFSLPWTSRGGYLWTLVLFWTSQGGWLWTVCLSRLN